MPGAVFAFRPVRLKLICVKISAVIIAQNEEAKIGRALESVAWADEVVVVDSGSTDRTVEIARSFGARVIEREWQGFSKQKQFATDAASFDRVISLDADEVISDDLRREIEALCQRPEAELASGYRIPRLSFYLDRPIRHGGWYPDHQLRFFDRRHGRWTAALVHESFSVEGPVEKLRSDILHFSIDDPAQHHRMIGERYAPLAAEQMFAAGRRAGALRVAVAGPAAFLRSFVLKLGFLDGFPGYCIARFAAQHAFLKYLLLYEKLRNNPQPSEQRPPHGTHQTF